MSDALAPLAILVAAASGGYALAGLADEDAPLAFRVGAGIAGGITLHALVGYALAWALGMGPLVVGLATAIAAAPVLLLRGQARPRLSLRRPGWGTAVVIVLALAITALTLGTLRRALLVEDGAILTGVDHNLGDLPFHLAIVEGFAQGGNLPPEHPELSGTRLAYPFLADFEAALLLHAGATRESAFAVENLALGVALALLLFAFGAETTGRTAGGALAVILFLADGGLGFVHFFREAASRGVLDLLAHPHRDYTIEMGAPHHLRWGNAVITLLVPQRALLLGLPLALACFTLLWRGLEGSRQRVVAAGACAALLPLAHVHAYVVVLCVAGALAVLFPRPRLWSFFGPALAGGLPQAAALVAGGGLKAGSFLGLETGWDHGTLHPVLFWLWNTGAFLPLTLVGLLGRGVVPARLRMFFLPFACCFVVPNLVRMSPWIWDNVKFLIFWWVGSVPVVALVLLRLADRGKLGRAASAILLALLTLSGTLDLWRAGSGATRHQVVSAAGVAFADRAASLLPPRALVLHAPHYAHPALLTGRRSLLGFDGHVWSQGLDPGSRAAHLTAIYGGGPGLDWLLDGYGIDYIWFGPDERPSYPMSPALQERCTLIASADGYHLFAVQH